MIIENRLHALRVYHVNTMRMMSLNRPRPSSSEGTRRSEEKGAHKADACAGKGRSATITMNALRRVNHINTICAVGCNVIQDSVEAALV